MTQLKVKEGRPQSPLTLQMDKMLPGIYYGVKGYAPATVRSMVSRWNKHNITTGFWIKVRAQGGIVQIEKIRV